MNKTITIDYDFWNKAANSWKPLRDTRKKLGLSSIDPTIEEVLQKALIRYRNHKHQRG